MSFLFTSRSYNSQSKQTAVKELLENTVPDRDFYILVISAIILATCGILLDNIPVLIASMIVAPLAYPIISMGLAIISRDKKLFLQAILMLFASIALAIIIGGLFSIFVKSYFAVADRVLISFFPNVFFDIVIAVVSGIVAVYGLVRPKVGSALTGIGIAVSLMPPLVAVGIGLFEATNDLALRGASIFLLNVFGILLGSIIMFNILKIKK